MKKRWTVLAGVSATVAAVLTLSCRWYLRRYQPDLRALLYTAVLPLSGTGGSVFTEWAANVVPGTLAAVAAFALAVWLVRRRPAGRRLLCVACALAMPCALAYGWQAMGIGRFVGEIRLSTDIYEQHYVDPADVAITADQPRSLICVYLESMETAYTSADAGVGTPVNCIPELTALAEENVSFSGGEGLGGFQALTGATWTMGALMTTTAGTPFNFPLREARRVATGDFAPDIITLGDVLADADYEQEFLCGSDASFGGRRQFFEQHGDYAIFDLNEAKRLQYVPEDYHVWWGLEDEKLYAIARDEATRLAADGKPFNLTLLTADTHFPDGYLCAACGDDYPDKTANVVACADRQAAAFVRWCLAQPFAERTTIVLLGDHPRMDTALVGHTPYAERPVYACFLHPARETASTGHRVCTSADMFPTILSALGFDIEGHRLGLGVDLFSGEPTLAETMGLDALNAELGKTSALYRQWAEEKGEER